MLVEEPGASTLPFTISDALVSRTAPLSASIFLKVTIDFLGSASLISSTVLVVGGRFSCSDAALTISGSGAMGVLPK